MVSLNVNINEIDQSQVSTNPQNNIVFVSGTAKKGKVNSPVLVGSDEQLRKEFGISDPDNFGNDLLASEILLRETDNLYFCRASDGTEAYANATFDAATQSTSLSVSATDSTALKTAQPEFNSARDIYDLEQAALGSEDFVIFSNFPGINGNDIGVKIISSADTSLYDWGGRYNTALDDSLVMKLEVYVKDENDSTFASVSANPPEEEFYFALSDVIDPSNNNLNLENVVNGVSQYVYAKVNNTKSSEIASTSGAVVGLTNGDDSEGTLTATMRLDAYSIAENKEVIPSLDIIFSPLGATTGNAAILQGIGEIAYRRGDSIAVIQGDQTPNDKTASTIISNASSNNLYSLTDPSYSAAYVGWTLVNNRGKNVYVPNSIFGANAILRTARVAFVHTPPAGLSRGSFAGLGQNKKYSQSEIVNMYNVNLNSIKTVQSVPYVWGQKTLQRKATAKDRLNVRLMLNYLHKVLEPLMLQFLFEVNNADTRLRVVTSVDPILAELDSQGAFNGDFGSPYQVICDTTNNTPLVIDQNKLILDVSVIPSKSIEEIKVNLITTKTGVVFS